jgi:hypothetical protein
MAFAGSLKISKDLEGIGPSEQIDVIVQFNNAPTGKQFQRVGAWGKAHTAT